MKQKLEIKQNWTGLTNFDNSFCVIFSCHDQNFISETETEH